MSRWPATERYGLRPAPGGLALVQDFLNTRAILDYGADLLSSAALANGWAQESASLWLREHAPDADPPALTDGDVARLRMLRDRCDEMVSGLPGDEPWPSVSGWLDFSAAGQTRWRPTGTGWRWVASALSYELLLAQHVDILKRLKMCRNPLCHSSFYDQSKNNSGVWHSFKVCGNAANLRASRARRLKEWN